MLEPTHLPLNYTEDYAKPRPSGQIDDGHFLATFKRCPVCCGMGSSAVSISSVCSSMGNQVGAGEKQLALGISICGAATYRKFCEWKGLSREG